MNDPKVSVSLITYNQENFIAACLDSIINQVVDFDFEIVVADDCSTDRTAKIVAEYASRYPRLIKPILRTSNLGLVKNAINTIESCTGSYIALMEGDDFWVDNHKLQIQADYLDKNPDCAFCFTNQYVFYEEDSDIKRPFYTNQNRPPEKIDLDFFINQNVVIPNNTKMFRKGVQPTFFPDWFFNSANWDWALHIFQAANGKIGYIDIITLAYRRHAGALFMSQNEVNLLLNGIATTKSINEYLGYKYNNHFKILSWEYRELSFAYLGEGKFINFFVYYLKYFFSFNPPDDTSLRNDLWRIRKALTSKKQK